MNIPRRRPIEPAAVRKGAIRSADVSAETCSSLNRGTIESVTLVEMLVVDHGKLLRNVAPDAGRKTFDAMDATMAMKITQRMRTSGQILLERFGIDESVNRFSSHRSDTVRAWVASAIGAASDLDIAERLSRMAVLADDPNPGTREWAWIALRPHIAAELKQAIKLLKPWTKDSSPNIRRFATESTRPCGVWCQHIQELKNDPSLGLPLLDPLKADETKYVQDSVANWLNDSSKSQPNFVTELCQDWLKVSPVKATARICQRAMRTIAKNA